MKDAHSNPDPGARAGGRAEPPRVGRGRRQLSVLFAIALATLVGSYALFYLASETGTWGTTNHGQWVQGELNVADLGWPLEIRNERTWWLWINTRQCTAVCQDAVDKMRALHILLNRDADRLQRAFTPLDGASMPDWLQGYPGMRLVEGAAGPPEGPGIYVVDPIGNLVFFYPLDTNPKDVLEDLKRLLKVSQIG